MKNFQITLRAARVNCGLTLKDVAKKTGRNVDTIMKYEKDSSNIPRGLMVQLIDIYGVDFDALFFGKESDFIGQKAAGSDVL